MTRRRWIARAFNERVVGVRLEVADHLDVAVAGQRTIDRESLAVLDLAVVRLRQRIGKGTGDAGRIGYLLDLDLTTVRNRQVAQVEEDGVLVVRRVGVTCHGARDDV